jgi:lipid-binding SYLF domain-containing protein
MKRILAVPVILIALLTATWAGDKDKDEGTLREGSKVLQEMLGSNAVPASLLEKANCVMVLPNVKKVGFGIGGSGGRGPMSCRLGKDFKGKWSAPAMFKIGGASAGLQIGASSSDFVLLIMSEKGVGAILNGKTKLGNEASVAAGPSGATTGSPINADVVTYGRAKGAFAGVSLSGASLEGDGDANKRLYGKQSAREVVTEAMQVTPGGEPLIALLNSKVAK